MSIWDKISNAVMDEKSKPPRPASSPPVAAPAPPSNMFTGFAAAAASVAPPSMAPAQADAEALNAVRKDVYVQSVSGHPSRYLQFLQMYEAVGHNIAVALNALKVSDANVTTASIIEDITAHEQLLDGFCSKAKSVFDSATQDTVGKSDAEAQSLLAENEHAAQEIARHTKETEQRNVRLAELKAQRQQQEQSVTAARQKAEAAAAVVRAELAQMKQTLSTVQ